MKPIKIGIMSQEEIRARTIAIAKGEYKPKPSDPKVWFPSMKSLSEVLSDHNRELLRIIAEKHPDSIEELAALSGRHSNNVTRTIKTMARYGLVEIKEEKRKKQPIAKATDFLIHAC